MYFWRAGEVCVVVIVDEEAGRSDRIKMSCNFIVVQIYLKQLLHSCTVKKKIFIFAYGLDTAARPIEMDKIYLYQ